MTAAVVKTPRTGQVCLGLAARVAAGNTYTHTTTTAVNGYTGVALPHN
ncbi:hypothetical protein STIP28_62 [Synechococcus T7-like virus S-TIP28]|uniref:Uncharacterized protein n=1 Tax=Synechococcus T7-like virus S-TIP28 TaxID=1332140 RepID=A0AAE8XGW6_9CAUD|nr:hypothetical protein STIP28_62 [Synechococcus T7-like virus S-TIP28]